MTHTVNGNILAIESEIFYDSIKINSAVMQTARQLGIYFSEYNPRFKITRYFKKDGEGLEYQPFIHVFDQPRRLSKLKANIHNLECRHLYCIAYVASGSHVSIFDSLEAKEIYDVTIALHKSLKRRMPKGLEVKFDDEHKLFLPKDFRKLIQAGMPAR